ncbi:unnamed protein product [Pseudo-nitzschia multistriata]|uniref:peptidylprolyl isomerase n=1 Tax=Pseudo-nitzschia multistriata TaxID=183589 RepID=A0A448Z068_9STRA|nr:unnamed protein product [Pseudo-nitzschia multistriata]
MVMIQVLLSMLFGTAAGNHGTDRTRSSSRRHGTAGCQAAVTDASVSPDQKGAGILVRWLRPARGDRWEENTCGSERGSERRRRRTTAGTTGTTPGGYRPGPGDTCLVRYDCYVLGPVPAERTGGPFRVHRRRARTWVDGNFPGGRWSGSEGSSEGRSTTTTETRRPLVLEATAPVVPALSFVVGAGEVLRGLEVAVQRMEEGAACEVVVPWAYGYGVPGLPPLIPPFSDLVLVVVLEGIEPTDQNRERHEEGGHARPREGPAALVAVVRDAVAVAAVAGLLVVGFSALLQRYEDTVVGILRAIADEL